MPAMMWMLRAIVWMLRALEERLVVNGRELYVGRPLCDGYLDFTSCTVDFTSCTLDFALHGLAKP
eukprot:5142838-Pyramimonas_sp.AAC.1